MKSIFKALLAAALLLPCLAFAAGKGAGEKLRTPKLPAGFAAVFRDNSNGVDMTEYVPKGQSVEKWQEMITIQVMGSKQRPSAEGIYRFISQSWIGVCGDGSVQKTEVPPTLNGYPVIAWVAGCLNNPQSGTPEFTFFKAIEGRDALYIAQYAFRHEPDYAEADRASRYLRAVSVCDSRVKAGEPYSCAGGKAGGKKK
ncbi:Uncharacterised protein [Kingella potus]|uniref:CNP1-like family n=1 Tax=Kingella potus TaxID=265175 RepID=A0A377QZ81_9NEIS|nr:hypothetical protein [Kingella potus]UOP01807.1 hypothetical protein LVJ84_06865 [Kingella potus]STQ99878.1 Uncharacterised protein [Kingella potus]